MKLNIKYVREWMKLNGVSIHKLAKYVGVTAPYFSNVLAGKEAMSKKLEARIREAMQLEDISTIKDMAYLKVPFTREEWKRIKECWSVDEDLQIVMHDRIMRTVETIELAKSNV